jgi:hypothetical protein
MRFGISDTKSMSNQALFTLIADKRAAIETLQVNKLTSIGEEIEVCYLIRERQRRFHKHDKHPECCIG